MGKPQEDGNSERKQIQEYQKAKALIFTVVFPKLNHVSKYGYFVLVTKSVMCN